MKHSEIEFKERIKRLVVSLIRDEKARIMTPREDSA